MTGLEWRPWNVAGQIVICQCRWMEECVCLLCFACVWTGGTVAKIIFFWLLWETVWNIVLCMLQYIRCDTLGKIKGLGCSFELIFTVYIMLVVTCPWEEQTGWILSIHLIKSALFCRLFSLQNKWNGFPVSLPLCVSTLNICYYSWPTWFFHSLRSFYISQQTMGSVSCAR